MLGVCPHRHHTIDSTLVPHMCVWFWGVCVRCTVNTVYSPANVNDESGSSRTIYIVEHMVMLCGEYLQITVCGVWHQP